MKLTKKKFILETHFSNFNDTCRIKIVPNSENISDKKTVLANETNTIMPRAGPFLGSGNELPELFIEPFSQSSSKIWQVFVYVIKCESFIFWSLKNSSSV